MGNELDLEELRDRWFDSKGSLKEANIKRNIEEAWLLRDMHDLIAECKRLRKLRSKEKEKDSALAERVTALESCVSTLNAQVTILKASAKRCGSCGSRQIERRIYVPTSRPEQWWDCQECKHYWIEAR